MKGRAKQMLTQVPVRLLNRKEVATMLGVSTRTVLDMAHRKQIPHVFVGRQMRFSTERLTAWLKSKTQEATA